MCGIAGVVTFDGRPADQLVLAKMTDALQHRGPDSQGAFFDGNGSPGIALGHRRLSVIDLSPSADQPMANEDGRIQLVMNGEIYNFKTLRSDLEQRHSFRSQGDAEVIAHLFEERGVEAIAALDGMFALAIWDGRTRQLHLARDPLGKKPLYYWHDRNRLLFGSEIKALLAGGAPASLDTGRLGEYLAYGYVPTPNTLFSGIKKLPPATVLTVREDGLVLSPPYWKLELPPVGATRQVRVEVAAEEVRGLLTQAVRKRLVADVPLGILLSGGVDSSAVAAVVGQLNDRPIKTFTVGFEGPSFYDERAPAREVASFLGTEHHEVFVKPDAASLMEKLLYHYDEPFGDSSSLPTYLVAQAARKHVTVVLNGDGGDEVFAGYGQFQLALAAERIPPVARKWLGALAGWLPTPRNPRGMARRTRRFLLKASRPLDERIFAWSNYVDLPDLERLSCPQLVDKERILASYRQALGESQHASLLSRLGYVSVRTFLLDDLLPKMDRMTMAHGLEARSPLLDRDMMEAVAKLPDGVKRRGSNGKICLKEAVRPLLPAGLLERPKHGFGVPIDAWFRADLSEMVNSTLLDKPRLGDFIPPTALERLVAEHRAGYRNLGSQLWMLLTLELWLRSLGGRSHG